MKYEIEKYKDTPVIVVEMGNTSIRVIDGEATCKTEAQQKLAESLGGVPAVTSKKTKKSKAVKSND